MGYIQELDVRAKVGGLFITAGLPKNRLYRFHGSPVFVCRAGGGGTGFCHEIENWEPNRVEERGDEKFNRLNRLF